MSNNRTRFRGITVALSIFLLASCLPKTTGVNLQSNLKTGGGVGAGGGGGGGISIVPAGAQFAISQSANLSMNLGIAKMFQFTVTGASSFSGTVNLSVQRDELDLVDPAKYVTITLNPSTVALSGGNSVQVQATVTTNTMAPNYNDHFHIVGSQAGVAGVVAVSSTINLQVMPVFEMPMLGGAVPEAWGGATPLNFRANTAGVTIQFVNYDSALAHLIHSGGAIPHQNAMGPPLTKSVAGTPQAGGTYAYLVPKGAVTTTATYYCHLHEGVAQGRVMNFNVGAASAKFATGVKPILNAKCLSCHQNTATGAAGISYATYTDTIASVVAGNAAGSLMHQDIASGKMPVVGAPQLTAAEKLIIMDWINAGALNN